MEKVFLILLLITFGEADRCKTEMTCTECTAHSCFYVELANINFCMEGAFGFEKPVKFVTSPNECPFTSTTSTYPPSSPSPTSPITVMPVPPPPRPSSDNSPAPNINTGKMTGCAIIILVIIIVISTVAATYFFKKKHTARGNRFARFRVDEAYAVTRF